MTDSDVSLDGDGDCEVDGPWEEDVSLHVQLDLLTCQADVSQWQQDRQQLVEHFVLVDQRILKF